jgi:glycosyltransferase involved in cell wall biosynthesis
MRSGCLSDKRDREAPMVLHLIASNFFGGPEKQILLHASRAHARSLRVGVGVFGGKGMNADLADRCAERGIPTFVLNTDRKIDLSSILMLRRIVQEQRVDIVCSHGFKADVYNVAVSKLIDLRTVGFVRGDTAENFKVALYTCIDRYAIKTFDKVIAVSDSQKTQALRYGVSPDRIEVVRNAIDIPDIQASAAREQGDVEAVADIVANDNYILAVGRLSPEKGHLVLVEAMPQVLRHCPDIKLLIVGDGQEAVPLSEKIRALSLDGQVVLAGFSKQPAYYIRRAAVLVNPSLSEGLPNVVLEARALRTPVVATDVGGVSEVMADGRGGLLVPPNDPEKMAHAIVRLLQNSAMRTGIAEEGYGEFQTRFDADAQTDALLAIYRTLRREPAEHASMGRCA